MNTSELVYEGDLRCLLEHCYSGTRIFTDAPLDNHGKAQSFSPTDLVATALAACMMTIMGIEANKMGLELKGATISVKKVMQANPRKIAEVHLVIKLPLASVSSELRAQLEYAAHLCPVALSLHPDIKQQLQFSYY